MTNEPVELWLPSREEALPECLLGVPLLVLPRGESFFGLATSSVLTPLTWGDSVRAVPHPDGGYSVTALAAAGPHLRVVLTHAVGSPAMRTRTTAAAWAEQGAVAVESLPGLFVIAWRAGVTVDDVAELIAEAPRSEGWEIVEAWAPEDRTPEALAADLERC